MILRKWDDLPDKLRTEAVKPYYDILMKHRVSLVLKREFDVVISALLLIILSPVFLIIAVSIKLDSHGPVFFRQERITQYGEKFKIYKFRTMVANAEQLGLQVTVQNDMRVTRVGKLIRKCRLDEISQLIDIFRGTMTFVGTRPDVMKYVSRYSQEMMATLLLPAGVTSEASIRFKDEEKLLAGVDDVDDTYIETVLPKKMAYNLWAIANFSIFRDIKTMVWTLFAVLKREHVAPSFEVEKALDDSLKNARIVDGDEEAKAVSSPQRYV